MRYKLTVEYDGTGYYGWQRQQGLPTVQETLEVALSKFLGEESTLYVAGRTDKGVHALGQVCHLDAKIMDPWVFQQAANAHLRGSRISVLHVESVQEDFHARFWATSKTYTYHVINRRPPLTFQAESAWQVPCPLDMAAMEEAAHHLLGLHDFTSFRAAGCQSMSPHKTLDHVTIVKKDDHIAFTFEARSFLYHQVRNMVGALVDVGLTKWTPLYLQQVLNEKNRNHGSATAPAQGLYLVKIAY